MKVAALVLLLVCNNVSSKKEQEPLERKSLFEALRQSRGQSHVRAPQQSLSREAQALRYTTQQQQAVNYDGGSAPVLRGGSLQFPAPNPAPGLGIEEQSYEAALAGGFAGKDGAAIKAAQQRTPYSLASDVSQFKYSSPLVKYSNLGVLSQLTPDGAPKSLQKSESSQQARVPSQLAAQNLKGHPNIPQQTAAPEFYNLPAAAQQAAFSAGQHGAEEPTTYEALLGTARLNQLSQKAEGGVPQQQYVRTPSYSAQQFEAAIPQQQYVKPQGFTAQQIEGIQQQQYYKVPSFAATPGSQVEFARAPGLQSLTHHVPQSQQVGSVQVGAQYSAGLPSPSQQEKDIAAAAKSPFAEQIANFLGQFTLGSRGGQTYSPQAAAGPQKFSAEAASTHQPRALSPSSAELRQRQYLATQAGKAAALSVLQQAGFGQVPQQTSQPEEVKGIGQSGPPQFFYSDAPQGSAASQGAYVVGPQSVPQGAAAKSSAPQVVYADAVPQADYSSAASQDVYVPAQRAAAPFQNKSPTHSAYF